MLWSKVDVRACPRASEVLAVESGELSIRAMGLPFSDHVSHLFRRVFRGLSHRSFSSTLRGTCRKGSEPRMNSGEYVCMLSQVCPGMSTSTEDIRVRTTVWILQLIGRGQS